jgi:ATP-binding protein involved in chromosome partitioning
VPTQEREDRSELVKSRLALIGKKIVVMSGKGGVGKSTVAVNLAAALAEEGFQVGLLDIDIHGPSIPKMLGLEGRPISSVDGIVPAEVFPGLKAMSLGLFLDGDDSAVIWRGPMKYGAIEQLIADVDWGTLDFLLVDSPPGTGDEPLSVIQLMGKVDGAVIVTTPQDLALIDVARSIRFCEQLKVPVLGVVENMSGLVCPHCGERVDVFGSGGGQRLAQKYHVPFLGAVPLDQAVMEAGENGEPLVGPGHQGEAASVFARAAQIISGEE